MCVHFAFHMSKLFRSSARKDKSPPAYVLSYGLTFSSQSFKKKNTPPTSLLNSSVVSLEPQYELLPGSFHYMPEAVLLNVFYQFKIIELEQVRFLR